MICVYESISRWYGQGGYWINYGLPHYVAMGLKPENGCEIQDAACGRSGVMIQLKLVKSGGEELAVNERQQKATRTTRTTRLITWYKDIIGVNTTLEWVESNDLRGFVFCIGECNPST
jgi:hypothetical protein